MKLSTSKHSGSSTHPLPDAATIACDVSKDDIHLVAQFGQNRIERNFANQRTLIKELFPDFGIKKDFIFGKSGKAVMAKYKYNPYRICRSGKKRFQATMKRAVPRIRTTTLEKVFSQAQSSVKNKLSSRYAELIELQLIQRWQDLELGQERKLQAGTGSFKTWP
jgi:hypothetical protein